MEKNMEKKTDALGPFKVLYRDITPILDNRMDNQVG